MPLPSHSLDSWLVCLLVCCTPARPLLHCAPPLLLLPLPFHLSCRRKDAAAKGRADAKLQYVVISEKWDK